MRIASASTVMAAALSIAGPAPAFTQTLAEELAWLLREHPQIRAAIKGVESSRLEIEKSKAGYYPTVTVTADYGAEVIDNPAERALRADKGGKPSSRTPSTAHMTVTQKLYDANITDSLVKTARLNTAVSDITAQSTRQNLLFEGTTAYLDVLRQKRLISLSLVNERNIQRQFSLEDERVQRGSGIAVDVLQSISRLQLAKERRVSFEGALEDAISRYAQTFNHAPDIDAMVDPVLPVELIPSKLDTAINIAIEESPALLNSAATIEVARERRRTVKSEYFPTLDLIGSWNYEKHKGATIGTRRDYSLLLSGSWDLFTGFSTQASMDQATFDYSASKDNHDFVFRKVVEQLKLAWQALITVRNRLELLENAVNIATEVFESRKKLRAAGKETVINVLDSENEVNNARINFTSASYDEKIVIYQLLLAMGRLNATSLNLE